MKILNFGSCNIDYVYRLHHIAAPGETQKSDDLQTFAGGKGLNQSVAIAKAGGKVYHAGCIGTDGDMLLHTLQENAVDTDLLQRMAQKNGHAMIQVSETGENAIIVYPGTNAMIREDYVDAVLSHFSKGDILVLQNEINCLSYILTCAHQKGMTIILNPSPIQDALRSLDFHKISYMVLNEIEAVALFGGDDAQSSAAIAAGQYPNLRIVLTLGKNGSVYREGSVAWHQNAFRVKAVDTTAAGDTFMGYFVAGLAKGQPIPEILRLASAAAAMAVSKEGAAPSIPYLHDVEYALDTMEEAVVRVDDIAAMRKKLEKYVSEHLKDITLRDLAKHFNYSYFSAPGLIKKCTGMGFTPYVQSVRMARAAKLLLESDLAVAEIITQVGYQNDSFFRRKFKETYGKTPAQYRKKH